MPCTSCEVRPACLTSPLSVVLMARSSGSMSVEIHGPSGAERVVALGPRPLPIGALLVAGGDVVGAGVAEHDVVRRLDRHITAEPADDDGHLPLVVHPLG